MNSFSLPMPFNIKHIEQISEINKIISKSKITSLYNGLPTCSANATGFEQERVIGMPVNYVDDMFPYIEETFKHNIGFVFLLNGVSIPSDKEFEKSQENLYALIQKLMSFGVVDFRVANTLIAEFISKNFRNAKLHASTSFEFQNIKQYDNLFKLYSQFESAVPSFELNHNFRMLTNLVSKFPHIKWEPMVNEGCLAGCPLRNSHNMMRVTIGNGASLYHTYCRNNCSSLYANDLPNNLFMSNVIYPWQISTYNELGINHFKLVGRNTALFNSGEYIEYYRKYLMGIDDVNHILDEPIVVFSNYFISEKRLHSILVKDVIDYLPKIEHFLDNGHLCAINCGIKCNYCMDCATRFMLSAKN